MKRKALLFLAWTSVGLSIPMATLAIVDGFVDAAWEAVDFLWQKDDRFTNYHLQVALQRIENLCGAR